MKAAVFKGKGIIEVEEVEKPVCGENDVLLKVMAGGVCGTDVHIFEGSEGATPVQPPIVLGHEFSGIVEEVGSSVKGFKVGDRVTVDPNNMCGSCWFCLNAKGHFCENMICYGTKVNGGFAQYCAVHYKQLYRLEDHVSFEEGAFCEPVACCLHGIDNCEIKTSDTVMVIGGGPIGLIMVQLAKMSGAAQVVLLEPVEEKRALGVSVGADIAIDPIHEDVESVLSNHGIKDFNTVIECVGHKKTMLDAIKYASKNAVVMLFGLGNPSDEIPIKPFEIFRKEIVIKSSYTNPYTQDRANKLINSGRINLKSLIAETVSLKELSEVLKDPARRRKGKIIIDPWKD